jgi:hypothetical protein
VRNTTPFWKCRYAIDAIAVVHPRIDVKGVCLRVTIRAMRSNPCTSPTRSLQGTQEMSNTVTIAISAALLLAAAASAGSAAGPRASTTNDAIAAVCNEVPPLPQAGHCGPGLHCQSFNIGDRTVGPTFPTMCHQTT